MGDIFRRHTARFVPGRADGLAVPLPRCPVAGRGGAPAARPASPPAAKQLAPRDIHETTSKHKTPSARASARTAPRRTDAAPGKTGRSYKLNNFLNIDYEVFGNYEAIYAEKTLDFGAHQCN